MRDPYWYGGHHDAGGWWILMVVMMALFVAAAVALVVVLTRRTTQQPPPPPTVGPAAGPVAGLRAPDADAYASAERTLAERFALGEIGEDEFRAKLAVLRANTG